MKAARLLAILQRKPLRYRIVRQKGSHRLLNADGYPPITFSHHDRVELGPTMVRKILCDQVGLDHDAAQRLL